MQLIFYNKLKYIYKIITQRLFSVAWYESKNIEKIKIIKNNKYKLTVVKSKKNIYKKGIDEYFKKYKNKIKRLNKKNHLLALTNNNTLLSSGWIFFGKKWKIDEINTDVNLKKAYVLFDFETPKKLRNRGYYTQLLKLVQNKYRFKNIAIYSLTHNFKSINGIEKSGFKFIKKIVKK